MSSKRTKISDKKGMFHSIVLMGSGLALGCGGVAKIDAAGGASSSSGGHGGTSPSSASGYGGVGVIGAGGTLVVTPIGGTSSYGGASGYGGVVSAGGTLSFAGSSSVSGSGGTGFANPLPCPPAQWTCATEPMQCSNQVGGTPLGTNCQCDLTRPAQASACKPGQTFVCIDASQDSQGYYLNPALPFQCSCQPTPASCNVACDAVYGAGRFACEFDDTGDVLCFCQTAILLK